MNMLAKRPANCAALSSQNHVSLFSQEEKYVGKEAVRLLRHSDGPEPDRIGLRDTRTPSRASGCDPDCREGSESVETQVVEKIKEVEKEVQVVVTPTPLPAEKVVRINLGSYPDIIDPQKSSFVNEIAHLQMMYEGLTKLDKDLNTVPGAAEWEYNDDLTQVTFTLRDGLKYSDGSTLNAPAMRTRSSATSTPRPPVSTLRSPMKSPARPNGAAVVKMRPPAKPLRRP
jgi:hypothetical protein